jgi:hypothetical protein
VASPSETPVESVKPITAEPGKPSWAVMSSGKDAAPAVHPAQPTGGGSPHASWEVVGGPVPEALDRKGKGKGKRPADEEVSAKESSMQTALSYAGLVAALIVVLLGVIIMVGTGR